MDASPPETTGAGGLYCHRGTRAIQTLVEFAPSSGGLALWMRHLDVDHAEAPSIAANDGATVYYGPAFASLPLSMQTGLVAHQVLHVALRHPQRLLELRRLVGEVDDELFNVCADAIVNSSLSHLSWLELPPESVLLEDLLFATLSIRQSVEKSLLEWDLERLYRALDDRRSRGASRGSKAGAGSERESPATGAGAGAGEREAESDQTTAREDGERAARARALGATIIRDLLPAADRERPEAEAERSREWRERIVRAHAGDGVHSLLRELLADLPKTRIPWEQLLRTQLAHGLSLKRELSWSRPSRSYLANRGRMGRGRSGGGLRMPWEPGFSATRAVARLVVMVDVSGSIDHPLLERFAGEIDAIARRLEARVIVIIGDDRVTATRVFEPGRSNLKGLRFEGGGGTDFTPLLQEAARYGPDIGVFLTDLDGRVDFRPNFPVLWAVPLGGESMRPPFGRKLLLD